MTKGKLLLAASIVSAIALFLAFDLGQYLNLEFLKAQQARLDAYYRFHPLGTGLTYVVVYVVVTGLSLPGAVVMTLVGGAIFGLLWGTVIVSFASTTGATIAFVIARYLFRDAVQARFGDSLTTINHGMEKEGPYYLFTLRLVPAFPFVVINLAMALTSIPVITFAWVSALGMLAGTIVFVNAGTELGKIDDLSGILSPALIASFALLGIFPLATRQVVERIKTRRRLSGWARPKRFDRDIVVIGGGSAGLIAAYIAAAVRAKVSLVERHRLGGDCLYTGCVPSKALIRTARLVAQIRRATEYGLEPIEPQFRFSDVMERVQRVIRTIEPHDSIERYESLGVDCQIGAARIVSPFEVEVNGRRLTTRSIVIAAGASPFVPPIPGLEDGEYYTSDDIWSLRELPPRLVVLGGGPIGCELAQCFARFGSQVTLVELAPRLMIQEDPEVSAAIEERFRREGIEVRVGCRATSVARDGERRRLVGDVGDGSIELEFDALLVAVGRAPNTEGYGLEELGIETTSTRTIEVNEHLQTIYPNIYACGDVAGPYQFTHVSAHQAWYASVNALFGELWRFRADYSVIPSATFTDPEVARVGLTEEQARQRDVPFEVTRFRFEDLDRAVADEAGQGFVKVLTVPGRDKIIGATIVGEHAGELIVEYVAAMRHRFGLNKILGTVHIYPTLSEASKYAAGAWKRAHAPEHLLRVVARYHRWRRGTGPGIESREEAGG